MIKKILKGQCHCKEITFEAKISFEPENYRPRSCDCDYCYKQGVMVLSDPAGELEITIKNKESLSRYTHGSRTADCLFCKVCGVVMAVCYEEDGVCYGAINTKALERSVEFGDPFVVSPKTLGPSEKTTRWKQLWFKDVNMIYNF